MNRNNPKPLPGPGIPNGKNPVPSAYNPAVDLHTLNMAELYDTAFPPRTPLIEGLLCSGTYLLAGSPKIGKSFFVMQLAYHVAAGLPLWNYPIRQGTVLYLALEDDYARLQGRLVHMFGVDPTPNLVLTTQSRTIKGGLTEQMMRFVDRYPDTRLIIVDTLQRVREVGNENYSYAADYENINEMKAFSDHYNLCLIIVHHTRKMESNDSFETISGTTGLLGAADGAIILQKKKRIENTALMQIVGRDQEDQELALEFDRERCIWMLNGVEKTQIERQVDPILEMVAGFMADRTLWSGSAGELLTLVPELDLKPNMLTRRLNVNVSDLYNIFGIRYTQNERNRDRRSFTLERLVPAEEEEAPGDDDDCDDGGTIEHRHIVTEAPEGEDACGEEEAGPQTTEEAGNTPAALMDDTNDKTERIEK